ncbi:MAG: YfhO family protein [Patescibacteria group bacterium]
MKKYFLFALSIAIISSLPLFGARFIPTHDGEYHIIRFWQFYTMLSYGYLFPRWAPDLNSGYGLPLFLFHYPFPNYIGSFFHVFGVSFVDSVKLTLAAGYLTAVFWCFLWLKRVFGDRAAMIGTIVCSLVPYWFVDIYVRGSVGEVWALSFVLLTFAALEYGISFGVAIGIAGIIVSHNITAFIFIPIIFLYTWYRKRGNIFSIATGIGLATYFWLPALVESRFMVGLNSVSYMDHFPDLFQLLLPSWGTGFSGVGISADEMSYQIGIVPLLIVCISFFIAVRKRELRKNILPVFCVVVIAIFGMTEYSLQLWRYVPLMANIQYPWRLLMVPMIAVGYLSALLTTVLSRWIMVGLSLLAFTVSFSYMKPVTYEKRDDAHYLSRREFTDGTSSLGNSFTTIYTGWKKDRFTKRFQANAEDMTIQVEKEAPLSYTLNVQAKKESTIAAQILYFAGWKAYVDGKETPISYQPNGIIHVNMPSGEHTLRVRFEETPLRLLADSISLLSLFSLLAFGICKALYDNRSAHKSTFKRT